MLKILSVKGIVMAIVEKIHIAVNVSSLTEGEAFYTRLLGAAATKRVSDQIDWVIDNPPVHFSIFCNGSPLGIDHFGFVYRTEDIPGINAAFAVSDDGAIEGPDNLRVELYAIARD
jgi:catechol 2,3-dioxygenase-like lactoylglutathione lyase family enzyme